LTELAIGLGDAMPLSDTLIKIILLATGLLLPLLGLVVAPRVVQVLAGDLRLPRIVHYVAIAGLGMALWLRQAEQLALLEMPQTWLLFGLLVLCLVYAAIFAIVTNNIEDLAADRITNPDRPLVRGLIPTRTYLWAGICCQCVALGLSFAADVRMGWGIVAVSAGYWVYSCRPLRLKRVPILSKLLIGFNSLSVAVCGYALAGGHWLQFPMAWLAFILIPLSLAANFVDLKDTEGDRATGIATLPVLMGEPTARHLIAAATIATYVWGAVLLGIAWVYPLNAVGAALHVYFLYRKPYDERWVFLILIGALLGLDFLLFFSPNVF
jgi:chlorophyll synthase